MHSLFNCPLDDEAPAGLFRDDDDETAAQQPGLFPEEAQEDNQEGRFFFLLWNEIRAAFYLA